MYRYETHLHTAPVSRCAVSSVWETLLFYKSIGYDGVFITNHFLDGNINIDRFLPYEEKINFYFSDYEDGSRIGKEIGIRVFCGVELSYGGTDFLVYGLDKDWYFTHPEIMEMPKTAELQMMADAGALIVQAHPYREASYIDHIRLFPRSVHAVEVINASMPDAPNRLAEIYADSYGLRKTAGSDNHCAGRAAHLAGIETETPLCSVFDYKKALLDGKVSVFRIENLQAGIR